MYKFRAYLAELLNDSHSQIENQLNLFLRLQVDFFKEPYSLLANTLLWSVVCSYEDQTLRLLVTNFPGLVLEPLAKLEIETKAMLMRQ